MQEHGIWEATGHLAGERRVRGWVLHKPQRCRSLTPWECCAASRGCRHPGRPARPERAGGAAGGTAEPPSPWGSFPEGTPAATLWGAPYPQGCKNTAAFTALPPSPETSRVPGASSSPRFIFRGIRGASARHHQPLGGLRVHLSPHWPTVVSQLSPHRPRPAETVTMVLGRLPEMEPSLLGRSGRAPAPSWLRP